MICTVFIVFRNETLGIFVYKFTFNPRPLLTFLSGYDHHTHSSFYFRDEDSCTTQILRCQIQMPYAITDIIGLPFHSSFFVFKKNVCRSNSTLVQHNDIFFLL